MWKTAGVSGAWDEMFSAISFAFSEYISAMDISVTDIILFANTLVKRDELSARLQKKLPNFIFGSFEKNGSLGLSAVKIFLTAENAESAEEIYKNSAFSAGSAVKNCSYPAQRQRTKKQN
jgi:hypothetical protein